MVRGLDEVRSRFCLSDESRIDWCDGLTLAQLTRVGLGKASPNGSGPSLDKRRPSLERGCNELGGVSHTYARVCGSPEPRLVSNGHELINSGAMDGIACLGDATGVTLTGRTSDSVICSHWMERSP